MSSPVALTLRVSSIWLLYQVVPTSEATDRPATGIGTSSKRFELSVSWSCQCSVNGPRVLLATLFEDGTRVLSRAILIAGDARRRERDFMQSSGRCRPELREVYLARNSIHGRWYDRYISH